MMNKTVFGIAILLVTAMLWGFAFPFQREAMDSLQPYSFMALRFTIGTLSLVPLLVLLPTSNKTKNNSRIYVIASITAGLSLFLGAALQQIGLIYTTSGKAGFITGLYIIVVPILAALIGQKVQLKIWVGCIFAVLGLFFISKSEVQGQLFDANIGDIYTLICTIFWALQIIILSWAANKTDPIRLAFYQFFVCTIFCWLAALFYENFSLYDQLNNIYASAIPILYTGIVATGVAFTLQIVGLKYVSSSQGAVIMSLEAVFAAIAGYLLLNEHMTLIIFIGCSLMFFGMIISQIDFNKENSA